MDDVKLLEKLDAPLRDMLRQQSSETVSIIVQTVDGLKDDDRRVIQTLGGKVKDNLYIIDAFSADLAVSALESLVHSPRIKRIYLDAQVKAF